jgi:hypothetical protein
MISDAEIAILNDLRDDVISAKGDYYGVINHLAILKNTYALNRAEGIFQGTIVGKNESEREASARLLFSSELDAITKAETIEREAKYRLECAEIQYKHARMIANLKYGSADEQ